MITQLSVFMQTSEVLFDIEFFSGMPSREILDALDDDMSDLELLYTLEDLRERIVVRLVEEGRTYSAPDGIGSSDRSSREGYFG